MQQLRETKQNKSTCRTRSNRIPALESLWLDTIRKYFRKWREYMQAYREGKSSGTDVKSALFSKIDRNSSKGIQHTVCNVCPFV